MTTFFAVCNVGGPISVEIEADSVDEAIAEFEAMNKRELIDDATTHADDYYDHDCTGQSEEEFEATLQFFNCEHVMSLDQIINHHAGTVSHLAGGWSLWKAGEKPVVEVCSCTEWVRDRDLDKEGIDESDLDDAANAYASAVFNGLRERGFERSWPGGNRSLYHQWNGAHFATKRGCVASWQKLTEAQIEAIDEVRKAAQAEVNARWVREKFDFPFATDGESGTIKAESFEEACEQLEAMCTEEALADGAWGWVEDQDGDRFLIGEKPE